MTGLYPENPVERALVDEVLDSIEDIFSFTVPSVFVTDKDEQKAIQLKFMEADKLPYWFNKFEARYTEYYILFVSF